MNNSNHIINLLLKENGLPIKIKSLKDNFDMLNRSVESINKTIDNVSTNVGKGLGQVGKDVDKVADKIQYGVKSAGFVAVTDAVRNAAEAFTTLSSSGSTFEQSMANLSATTGLTGKDLEELSRIARESGAASGIGAAEAANAFTQLASEIKVSKVGLEGLKTLQQQTITLSKAGGIGMTEAATAMTDTINQFGLGADDANRIINLLAAGSQNGTAGITDLAASLKVTGAAALASGVSVEQAAGAIEVLSRNNLKGAEAGTALSGILAAMQSSLNIDLSQTGLSSALESLTPLLGNTSELTRIFGETNAGAVEYLIQNAASVAQMTTALTDTNVAQDQAAIRATTTAERMAQMQATIDDAKISLFEMSGGASAYTAVMADNLVVVAQLMPLLSVMGNGLSTLTSLNFQAAATTAATTLATVKSTAAHAAHAVQQKVAAAATTTMAVAQRALNAVMAANPIALVVLAISALVSGIVVAYNYFDGFRRIVDSAWEGVGQLASAIWSSLVGAFEKVSAVLAPVWGKLKALLGIQEETVKSTEKVTAATNTLATAQSNAFPLAIPFTAQKSAMEEEALALEKRTRLWRESQEIIGKALAAPLGKPSDLKPLGLKPLEAPAIPHSSNAKLDEEGKLKQDQSGPIAQVTSGVADANKEVQSFTESIWGSNSVIGRWAENATASVTKISTIFNEFGAMLNNDTLTTIQLTTGGLQAMGAMMGAMGGLVDGAAGSWLSWGANVLATIANALPQLLELFGVQCAVAVAGAATSVASIPIVGWIMAGVAIASVIAALATIPKPKAFAQGGLVYGNTFAQIGEYPGAANNPEVVAPLNKLRQLIQPTGQGGGTYEFRLRGRDFVAVAAKYDNINNRTR